MKRYVGILFALCLLTGVGTAQAGSILYYNDFNVGTDRMAAALAAVSGTHTTTVASSPANFATQLAGGGFDLAIFFQQNSSGADYDAAFAALATFIGGGGAAIADDWTRNNGHVAAFGASFTGGGFNQNQLTVTDAALAAGLTNPVNLSNPGWGVFSTDITAGSALALFPNLAGAIVGGNGGRTLLNGFLADTFVDGAEGTQLYINEIGAVLQVPEPASLLLFGLGTIAAVRARRRTA